MRYSEAIANLTHEDIIANHPDLVAREVQLEEEACNVARENLEKAIDRQGFSQASPTGKKALRGCIKQVADRIDEWLESVSHMPRKPVAYQYLSMVTADQAAYLVTRESLNFAMNRHVNFTLVCTRVGRMLKEMVDYALFLEANPGLAKKLDQQLKYSSSERHRSAVMRAGMRSADFEGVTWCDKDVAAVGVILVNCLIDATDLFERVSSYSGGKQRAKLHPTPTMDILLAEADIFDSLLVPYHYPMCIPPKPWTGVHEGGYLNQQQHPIKLVKTHRTKSLKTIDASDISDVMDAVNTIQATPWRINTRILQVMEELHASGDGSAKLASSVAPLIPEKSWGEMERDEWEAWKLVPENAVLFKAWRDEARDAYKNRAQWTSKRLVQQQQLKLANRFREEECIYFPHTLDFRGRVYPAAGLGSVNPQGNDAGKSLLEFARSKPLGETGARWLCVHVANCYGADKIALDDREMWTFMHHQELLDYARDPLLHRGWMQASKPFGFLAACFEYAGWTEQGDDFVSRIPVAMDGSCSGLQHFAAQMKCVETAKAVNVIATGNGPADVYTVVLNKVRESVVAANDSIAREWEARLSRDTVKHPTMTTPYGVSARGIRDQITAYIKKALGDKKMDPFSVKEFEAAGFLAPLVNDAIGSEVKAARIAMDWLTEIAKITAQAGHAVHWTTAVGFLAIQDYRHTTGRTVVVTWAGQRQKLNLAVETSKVYPAKQMSGLAPNWIHSHDAAHLMITVNNCKDHGIDDFAMIHDSFGCHAADVELLNAVTREGFIEMYRGDVLADFYWSLEEQLPPDVFAALPPPPEMGDLDIEAVRDSEYFFA